MIDTVHNSVFIAATDTSLFRLNGADAYTLRLYNGWAAAFARHSSIAIGIERS